MLYSKRKDSDPNKTVEKIKQALKTVGIENLKENVFPRLINGHVTEAIFLTVADDPTISSNGKGVNLEFAKASAYGEFIERMQNGIGFNLIPPDAKLISKKDFLDTGILDYWINQKKEDISKYLDKVADICSNFKNDITPGTNNIEVVPFYHLNTNKIEYLPIHIFQYMGGFTGNCAGNTPHEALIEGLSEICERYIVKKVIKEPVSFPDIPESFYIGYEEIKKITDYIHMLGFDIIVKDASLNGNFPVACVVLIDKKNNRYYVRFGAHPSILIAIERCFTELFQGLDFSDKDYVNRLFPPFDVTPAELLEVRVDNALNNNYFEVNSQFFTKEPDYKFDEKNWLTNEDISNKELFKKFVNSLMDKNMNVFIRNISFLGFTTYSICIPELMTNLYNINPQTGIEQRMNYYKFLKVLGDRLPNKLSAKEIKDFFTYYNMQNFNLRHLYPNLEMMHIIALLHNNELKESLEFLSKYSKMPKFLKYSKMFNCLKDYINILLSTQNKQEDIEKLKTKYGKWFTSKLEMIFFSEDAMSNAVETLKKTKLYTTRYVSKRNFINKQHLTERLLAVYKTNLPDQNDVPSLMN